MRVYDFKESQAVRRLRSLLHVNMRQAGQRFSSTPANNAPTKQSELAYLQGNWASLSLHHVHHWQWWPPRKTPRTRTHRTVERTGRKARRLASQEAELLRACKRVPRTHDALGGINGAAPGEPLYNRLRASSHERRSANATSVKEWDRRAKALISLALFADMIKQVD